MTIFSFCYRLIRKIKRIILLETHYIITIVLLKGNNVKTGRNLRSSGFPKIDVSRQGCMRVGNNFKMNNGAHYNMIGRQEQCHFIVIDEGRLVIGNNVGLSSTAIVCTLEILIGNNVLIGGNTVIYDTDFHSLNSDDRKTKSNDCKNTLKRKVVISDNVFIGAHTTILKGVRIGKGSIVGACSLVAKDIPENEIWAGNPAKFIRKIYAAG